MDNKKDEKQLELPKIKTGYCIFIKRDAVCFPGLDFKTKKLKVRNELKEYQTSFAF